MIEIRSIKIARSFSAETHHKRSGAALVIVMVCLLLMSIATTSLLRSGMSQRRQTQWMENQLQTQWLVQSGIERALARRRADSTFHEEEWTVHVATHQRKKRSGRIRLRIEQASESPETLQITAVGAFPWNGTRRVQITRIWEIKDE